MVNVNGINFKYFFPLFYDTEGWDIERLPIRCSGITDKDPKSIEIDSEKEEEKTKGISY